MTDPVYPAATHDIGARRRELAPDTHQAVDECSRQVFAAGGLPPKSKQLIAVAVAHATQCPYCIIGHAKLADRAGAGNPEIMEAIWVAAGIRAGGAFAHSTVALHTLAAYDHEHLA
ncbi:carboxymuconolactone decarboxylase family protein [Nocardia sp. NPDC050193]